MPEKGFFNQRAERRDQHGERLDFGLKKMSQKVNEEFFSQIGANLLLEDGSLNMYAYQKKKKDGPFRKTRKVDDPTDTGEGSIENDKEFVRGLDLDRAYEEVGVSNTVALGVTSPERFLELYEKKRLEKSGIKLEMVLTLLLHKVLGKDFLVVRSSAFDDNKNGVDHLVIDRRTGNVVCTFDEVNDEADGDRMAKKNKKIQSTAQKGGSSIKYGLTFTGPENDKKIERGQLDNVPLFALALSSSELDVLLGGMDFDPESPCDTIELQFFAKLMQALQDQQAAIAESPVPKGVKNRLEEFKVSFARMRELGQIKSK